MAEQFTPVTDEVWRLQTGNDPECLAFQAMSENGHYGSQRGHSRQGTYVCTANGQLLASGNSLDPDKTLQVMHKGLRAWQDLPEATTGADAPFLNPKHRWEDSFPKDGLVLTLFTRDLPAQCDPDEPCAAKWNRDVIWFSREEARQWLPEDTRASGPYQLPTPLIERLARLHFVDTVKGQTRSFRPSEVQDSLIHTEIIDRRGNDIRLRITGKTHSESKHNSRQETPHGVTTAVLGEATFDVGQQRFVAFECVALGERWGRTRFNGRRHQIESSPVGFVVQLRKDDAPKIAPAFVGEYKTDWMRYPPR